MELDSFHQKFLMPDPHNLSLFSFGADLKAGRQGVPFGDERMITRRFEGIGKMLKDGLFIMLDHRGFSMHEPPGPNDVASERLNNGLMSQTDSQNRDLA